MAKACPDHNEYDPLCMHCSNIEAMRQAGRNGKIEFAGAVLIDDLYAVEGGLIREAINHINPRMQWGDTALISDKSSIWDFGEEYVEDFYKYLRLPPLRLEQFGELAKRLRERV